MKFNLFTQVRLNQDLPEYNLKRGEIGTIVEYYHHSEGEDGYSLEGLIPLDTVEVWESQIELICNEIEKKPILSFKYELIINWSDEDDCFIVEVPELLGCFADGKTYHEAVSNAQINIQEWLETAQELSMKIPEPKRC